MSRSLFLMTLAACGGTDFDGTWNGSLTMSGTCEQGTNPIGSSSGDMPIESESDTELVITYLPCSPAEVKADISGKVATLRETTCRTSGTSSFGRETLKITGGTLTLGADLASMDVIIDEHTTNPDPGGTCNVRLTGSMTKKEE